MLPAWPEQFGEELAVAEPPGWEGHLGVLARCGGTYLSFPSTVEVEASLGPRVRLSQKTTKPKNK